MRNTVSLTIEFDSESALEDFLHDMNNSGVDPVLAGRDSNMRPFLAFGYEVGGEEMFCGVMFGGAEDPAYGMKGDCPECGRHPNSPLSDLRFPVVVL